MPTRKHYAGLALCDAVRKLAEHHGAKRTRHISEAEVELLLRAADVIEAAAPNRNAFA